MTQAAIDAAIETALEHARRIRAVGPTTDEFMRWRDEIDELLAGALGEGHELLDRYRAAIGQPGHLDAEGLQIHGPYGMDPRLQRAEAVLRDLLAAP